MTVEIKGTSIKITLTDKELKILRTRMPYEVITLIDKSEADPDGYASENKEIKTLPGVESLYRYEYN